MSTHIRVSDNVKEKLESLRVSLGLRSADAVIERLVEAFEGVAQEDPADASNSDDRSSPPQRRKINVREPLYSLESMAQRDGMLEYYTGFDRSAIELLVRRMEEVCMAPFLFWCPSSVMGAPV